MGFAGIAALLLGYVGQFLKAKKSIPTWLAQAIMGICGVALYALVAPPINLGEGGWIAWIQAAIGWALTPIGAASLSAGTGAAPKTDSVS